MAIEALSSAGAGALFGAALMASGVHRPTVILEQLRLRDFRMLHVFMVAMGASAFVMYVLEKLNRQARPIRANTSISRFGPYDGNLVGGAILGVGMALSGACPGTVLVQLANGVPSAQVVAVGALAGAAAHVQFGHLMKGRQHSVERRTTMPEAVRLSDTVVYLAILAMITGILRVKPVLTANYAVAPIFGGLLIGGAQAASMLLTRQPVGVSAGFEQMSRYVLQAAGFSQVEKPHWPPRALVFSLGIFVGALTLGNLHLAPRTVAEDSELIPTWQALMGGFASIFGARTAGGCTSGHGISGMSALSLASLIAVAGMFGAGIGTRLMLDAIGL